MYSLNIKCRVNTGQYFLIFSLICLLTSCSLVKPIRTTFEKTDAILGKAQGQRIDQITKKAAEGFISGINLDSINTKGFIESLLNGLGLKLDQELNAIELDSLKLNLSRTIIYVLQDERLMKSLRGLVDSLKFSIGSSPVKIKINPTINGESLLRLIHQLRDSIINESTSQDLGAFMDHALLTLAEGNGLDSIINKVNSTVNKIDNKIGNQTKNLDKLVGRLWWALASLGGLAVLIIGYAYRKRVEREKYKNLATVLSKGIDKIPNQSDYDTIVKSLREEAGNQKVSNILDDLVNENRSVYTNKANYPKNSAQAEEALRNILNSDKDMSQRLMKATEKDKGLNLYIKDKLLNK